ncbi:MAG: phenylalanine--tRNA ligase subunit alpha [bacterium]
MAQLQQLQAEGVEALAGVTRAEDAIQVKNRFLGRNGGVQELMKFLRDLPPEGKRDVGQVSNACKNAIEDAYRARMEAIEAAELTARLASERIDVTMPSRSLVQHGGHPIATIQWELIDLFTELGFEVADGPEIESDYYNFEALNFPHDHPARDMQDTFMLEDGHLLRTHTSPVQVRTMLSYDLPIMVISPGRVFRCDSDITHSPVFHQVEGLHIDENVTMRDLLGTLNAFAERYFGAGTKVRLRPSFFPFTEPSAEVDIGCVFCGQAGCRVCKHTGWIEILGCGMVDPNVLEEAGVDSTKYSGYAFGMGVERIAMLKLAVNDIRLFYENDIRFLRQF